MSHPDQSAEPPEAIAADDTLAAPLTAAGRGAIAVIAVRGPAAQRAVRDCFAPASPLPAERFPLNAIRYGRWLGPAAEREGRSGEAVVVVATADDAVEVHCHGGRAAVAAILQDLAAAGVATVDAETLLARPATLQPPIASSQVASSQIASSQVALVEITRILAQTSTERTAAIALDQLRGAMGRFCATLAGGLRNLPPDSRELTAVRARIAEVLGRESLGAHLAEPWKVVLAGPPNVGKSSLLNALLGYRRAITFAAPGTTRDVVSADAAIAGWPVRLSDTAGVRATAAELEAEGVRRTGTALEGADLVLLVIDSQSGLTPTHRELRARTSAPCLLVWNKSDLAPPPDAAAIPNARAAIPNTRAAIPNTRGAIPNTRAAIPNTRGGNANPWGGESFAVSATCGTGLAELEAGISRALVPAPPAAGDPVPLTAEQRAALRRAIEASTAAECLTALEPLAAPADRSLERLKSTPPAPKSSLRSPS